VRQVGKFVNGWNRLACARKQHEPFSAALCVQVGDDWRECSASRVLSIFKELKARVLIVGVLEAADGRVVGFLNLPRIDWKARGLFRVQS
jgi:hypothetical protein